jgi:hypothetical protein
MFSYSNLEAFSLLVGVLTVIYCTYEEVVKRLAKEPVKTAVKPHLRHPGKPVIRLARTAENVALKQTFTVEIKGSKDLKVLTKENFKELLSPYFIAVDYLRELWLEHPFNLIITDDLIRHYGKNKDLNGFIRYRRISEIYIKASTSSKHRTGVLIHEIAHLRAEKDAQQKKIHITSHGKEFKRHMRILFKPLLEDRTYYKKNEELSYHLKYETTRFTPTRDQCA